MSTFHIIPSSEDQKRFDAFAAEHGGVWYSAALRDPDDGIEQFVLTAEDGQWVGGFQLCRMKLKGVSTLSVPPLHPHCALFVLPREGGQVARLSYRKHIAAAVALFLNQASETLISVPLPPEWVDVQPFIWAGFQCTVKYTYRLSPATDVTSALFSAKTRNSIRKAGKDGVEVVQTGAVDEVWKGLESSAAEKGFEVDKSRLTRLLSEAGEGYCYALAAKAAGRVVASAICVYDKEVTYYLLGGVDRAVSAQGALASLVSRAIEMARERGCRIFDFEGSMIPEVEQFVRGFGGEIQPYYVVAKSPDWMVPLLRLRGKKEF